MVFVVDTRCFNGCQPYRGLLPPFSNAASVWGSVRSIVAAGWSFAVLGSGGQKPEQAGSSDAFRRTLV
jgi:hypothetical protein